jgi:hypothetical protein
MEHISPYATQSNNPNDLYRQRWNESQVFQQQYLSQLSGGMKGGSWSQPPWNGWCPIYGAGHIDNTGSSFLQRYAQDGDSGFFFRRGLFGRGEPIGISPLPPNHFDEPTDDMEAHYEEPQPSTVQPAIVQPAPYAPLPNLELQTNFNAEPQQRATYAPPYSHLLKQGMGQVADPKSALHEEPLELPKYKGGFHKKERRFK